MSRGAVNNEAVPQGLMQATDVPHELADMLAVIFQRQAEFAARLERDGVHQQCKVDFKKLYEGRSHELHKLYRGVQPMAQAMMMESAELLDWTQWKHWSQQLGNKRTDVVPGSPEHVKEMRVECADILCFLVNACRALGMTAEDLFDEYMAKAKTNQDRQDTGKY